MKSVQRVNVIFVIIVSNREEQSFDCKKRKGLKSEHFYPIIKSLYESELP